jgi:acetyl-CoA decarbonylase/synthase complex subunit epsilon
MVMRPVPWQTGEICGPDSAKAITKSGVLERDLKKIKKPLIIVGSGAIDTKHRKGTMIDYAIELSDALKAPVIATGHTIKGFLEKGFANVTQMGAMELPQFLTDPEWKGPNGKGPHDSILIFGIPYYMQWTLLSSVMNFGTHLTAISLSRHYQPHAKWSFPNMKEKLWHTALDEIVTFVKGGGE